MKKEITEEAARAMESALANELTPKLRAPADPRSNCISYWFPLLKAAGLPVPETRIVQTEARLIYLLDGVDPPEAEAWERFQGEIKAAGKQIGYPLFLRSGHYSGKHSWKKTCLVPDVAVLMRHVAAIVNDGECASFVGFPWDTWAVRELLPTRPIGTAFWGEMPIAREVRVFVDGGEIECLHPYWPFTGCLEDEGFTLEQWGELSRLTEKDEAIVRLLAERAGIALGGRWSVDLLDTERGWCVTDVARAEESFHYPGCANDFQRAIDEDLAREAGSAHDPKEAGHD